MVECLDGLARITSKELAITHSAKNGTLQNACFYKTKSGCRFGEKCSFAHRQFDEQPTKRSKKNDDKSAVALLKKGNWQEREPVTDEGHDRPGKPGKRSDEKLGQNSSERQSSDARQLGWRMLGTMTPPKSYSPEGHRHAEANPDCEIHKGYCTSHQNSRPKSFARKKFAQVNLMSVAPTLQNLRIGSLEETEWQEQGAREGSVEAGQKCVKIKGT